MRPLRAGLEPGPERPLLYAPDDAGYMMVADGSQVVDSKDRTAPRHCQAGVVLRCLGGVN